MKAAFVFAFLVNVTVGFKILNSPRWCSRAATSSLSVDESARSKNKIRAGIRNTRESLVNVRNEGKDKIVRLFSEMLLNAKTSFVRAVEASVVFLVVVKGWLLSKLSQLQGQGSKQTPASLPPAKATPRVTSTLLPIEEAKLLVKKKLEAAMPLTVPAAPTRTYSYATTAATPSAVPVLRSDTAPISSTTTAAAPLAVPVVRSDTAPISSTTTAAAPLALPVVPVVPVVRPDPAEALMPTVSKTVASAPPTIASASSAAVSISTTPNEEATEVVATESQGSTMGTMSKIKSLGTSGIIAYIISEAGFWLLSIPAALVAFHNQEGAWLQLSVEEDRAKILALTATMVAGARLLVPLRFSIAVALTPWIEKMRTGAMMGEGEQSDNGESAASNT